MKKYVILCALLALWNVITAGLNVAAHRYGWAAGAGGAACLMLYLAYQYARIKPRQRAQRDEVAAELYRTIAEANPNTPSEYPPSRLYTGRDDVKTATPPQ